MVAGYARCVGHPVRPDHSRLNHQGAFGMTRTTLGRRIGALEQAQPATLPFSLRRWLGERLTDEQHRLADVEVEAANGFVGPRDHHHMDADMLDWLLMRGEHHAS
jgi:hypothetical protein